MGKKDLRIYALLDALRVSPILTIKELADKFQVSEMTIRRDLDFLKENHLLFDNALSKSQEDEYIYSAEQIKYLDKEERIAQFAIGLIEKNDILILDSGTATGVLSKYIPDSQPLTVLCYNLYALSQLSKKENLSLIFSGGYYHRKDMMFECREGVELIRRTRASKMFVTASGIHEKLGLTCAHDYETVTKRAALDSALTKILITDSSKFGQVRAGYFAQLNEIDMIITDDELPDEWISIINSLGIALHLVGEKTASDGSGTALDEE